MSKDKGDKPYESDSLREHELAKKLVRDGMPVEYLTIKGYVGKSESDDTVRLYLNKEFSDYIEVKKSDILHAEEITSDELEFGGTCIWIKKDAELTRVRIESRKQQARFMEGDIARAQLRPEYVSKAIGRVPGVQQSLFLTCATHDSVKCGSLFAPVCPSDFVPCTTEWYCGEIVTAVGPNCVTPFCPTPRCPSINRTICPSQVVICSIRCDTPRCPVIDPDFGRDPMIQLKQEIEKLKAKVKKLEEEKA